MSGVSNGDLANESTFDSAYMYANGDTGTVGKVSLLNTDPISGDPVVNTQRLLNELADTDGLTGEGDPNAKVYLSNNYVADGDDRKVAIEKLDQQLGSTQTQLDNLDTLNSQDVTIDPIGSTPNASGMTLSGQNLNLEPANATNGGVLTAGTQTIGGDKTFANNVTHTGVTTFNGNAIFNSPITFPAGSTGINSTNLEVTDKNIFVNVGGNDASSEGSGLTVDRTGTDGSLIYKDASATKWAAGALGSEVDLVGTTSTQTLTNKTLTSPVINSPTGITKTDVGLSNVTNDAQLKRVANDFSSFTEKTTLVADDVFIIEDSEDTGAKKFVKKSNLGAGGSGGGVQNLIPDGTAEAGIANYIEGSYTAATRPSGTFTASSGAGAFAISTTTTNPINSLTTFLLTKSAGASRQGRAIERTVTLDQEYRTKNLQMRIKYRVQSGTFVAGSPTTDSSAIFYIGEFNGTTWKYTEPSSFKALSNSTTIVDYVSGTFQVSNDTTQIKLISYVAETANSAWVLQCEFEITPSVYVYGTPITDWQQYIPTFVALGTVTGIDVRWRRNGQSVEIEGRFTSGTVTGSSATISLPAGLVGSPTSAFICGDYGTQGTTTGSAVVYNNATNVLFFGMANWGVAATGTQVATGGFNSFNASVPIQGWSSSVQMSDSADTRSVSFMGYVSTNQVLAATVTNLPLTARKDTHGAWSGSTYIIPSAGDYLVGSFLTYTTASTADLAIYKNGTIFKRLSAGATYSAGQFVIGNSTLEDLKAGDIISIRTANFGVTVAADTTGFVSITKILGPSAIAANETVNLRYTNTAGTSIANSGDIVVPFATRDFDSHGSWVTDTFTAQTSGKYEVNVKLSFASAAYAAGNRLVASIYKNGSFYTYGAYVSVAGATTLELGVSLNDTVSMLAGETLQIRVSNNRTAGATSIGTSSNSNSVNIKRVGN